MTATQKLRNWITSGGPIARWIPCSFGVLLLFSWVCTLSLPLALLMAYDQRAQLRGSYFTDLANLQNTQGKIVSSELRDEYVRHAGMKSRYQIVYEYQCGENVYRSRQVTFANEFNRSSEYARMLVEKYPAGSQVTVYFDPGDPAFSALEPSNRGGYGLLLTVMAIGAVNLPVMMLYFGDVGKNGLSPGKRRFWTK